MVSLLIGTRGLDLFDRSRFENGSGKDNDNATMVNNGRRFLRLN